MVKMQTLLNTVLADTKTTIVTNTTYIDFGTGTTTPTSGDTVMESSVLRKARQEYLELANAVIVSGFLGSSQGNGSDITELGGFDASSGGNMQFHNLITAVTKTSDKELWVDERTDISVTQN